MANMKERVPNPWARGCVLPQQDQALCQPRAMAQAVQTLPGALKGNGPLLNRDAGPVWRENHEAAAEASVHLQ